MSTNNNVHVKLQYNDEYRRFFITRSCKFGELYEKIKSILNVQEDFVLRYKDEEEEWITISSDMELETGLILGNNALFRLQVSLISTVKPVQDLTMKNEGDVPCDTSDENDKPWRKYGRRGGRRCGRGRRFHGKWRGECDVEGGDEEEGSERGGRHHGGRRFHGRWRGEGDDEGGDDKPRWKHGKKWRKHCKKFDDEGGSSSEENGDSLLTLEEIKAKVEKLKVELKEFKEKSDKSKTDLVNEKMKLRELRSKDPIDTNAIIEAKKVVREKRDTHWSVFKEVKIRRKRIHHLKRLAETKNV
jgi:hypothetical protein